MDLQALLDSHHIRMTPHKFIIHLVKIGVLKPLSVVNRHGKVVTSLYPTPGNHHFFEPVSVQKASSTPMPSFKAHAFQRLLVKVERISRI